MIAPPLAAAALAARPEPPTLDQQQALWASDRDTRLAWWRNARFGMFIHWGLYSGAGGTWNGTTYKQHYAEWIQNWAAVPCDEYARQMKPKFRPAPGFADAWASLAADAGMKYAVMTAKHHEGFTLFNSRAPYSLDNPASRPSRPSNCRPRCRFRPFQPPNSRCFCLTALARLRLSPHMPGRDGERPGRGG